MSTMSHSKSQKEETLKSIFIRLEIEKEELITTAIEREEDLKAVEVARCAIAAEIQKRRKLEVELEVVQSQVKFEQEIQEQKEKELIEELKREREKVEELELKVKALHAMRLDEKAIAEETLAVEKGKFEHLLGEEREKVRKLVVTMKDDKHAASVNRKKLEIEVATKVDEIKYLKDALRKAETIRLDQYHYVRESLKSLQEERNASVIAVAEMKMKVEELSNAATDAEELRKTVKGRDDEVKILQSAVAELQKEKAEKDKEIEFLQERCEEAAPAQWHAYEVIEGLKKKNAALEFELGAAVKEGNGEKAGYSEAFVIDLQERGFASEKGRMKALLEVERLQAIITEAEKMVLEKDRKLRDMEEDAGQLRKDLKEIEQESETMMGSIIRGEKEKTGMKEEMRKMDLFIVSMEEDGTVLQHKLEDVEGRLGTVQALYESMVMRELQLEGEVERLVESSGEDW
ncbi:hypothetical protein HK097_011609 [Rhizophlyctis rosea]|uniref:Uncharacterized protein n=1 Tax=Rhizophlyctis rosea TaxID=64517 RepID=A0AAD5S8I9_9FUNG|nr:hypothetical protein HK097_011609 [Rhizophlyctis rosea]